jgi:glutamate 5-kinase
MVGPYLESIRRSKRIVVKLGTQVVMSQFGLAEGRLRALARDVNILRALDKEVILVSSGAVGLGKKEILGNTTLSLVEKQACAAVGQGLLMNEYYRLFNDPQNGLPARIAQILITNDDFFDPGRFLSLRATLNRLLSLKVVPIINENDPVSDTELRSSRSRPFGDNDMLSALVASKLAADVLVILTDVDGLFSDSPNTNPAAQHFPEISKKEQLKLLKVGAGSQDGRGGVKSKIEAARMAAAFQVPTIIANGLRDGVLSSIIGAIGAEVPRFTYFHPTRSLAKKSRIGHYGG